MGDLSEVRPEGLVDAWPPCEHGVTGDPQWTGTRAEWEVSRLDGRGRPADLLCEGDQPLPLPGGELVLSAALRSLGALTEGADVELSEGAAVALRAELTQRADSGQEQRTDIARDLRAASLDVYLYAIRGWLQTDSPRRGQYTLAAMHAICIWEALYEAEEECDDE